MRFEGNLKSWDNERGFGFIEPQLGGQDIFVHIKSFERMAHRPDIGLPVSFEIALSSEGKKRADRVQILRPARRGMQKKQKSPAQRGMTTLFAIPLFLVVFTVTAFHWEVPRWMAGLYGIMSCVCFIAYAIDKAAAVAGRRRISEATLIFLGMTGGWPGAIIAQQVLRHKSTKQTFRASFWGSVVVNVVVFIAVNSPLIARL